MTPLLVPIVSMLAEKGLNLLSNAIDKGSDKAIEYVSEKTGINLTNKPELSTDDIRVLKELEMSNKMDILNKFLDDKKDARNMQNTALNQDDVFSKRFVYYFAIGWSVFAMLFLGGITFMEIPESSTRFADTIVGFLLGTIVSTIIGFFYGSSEK